MPFFSITEQEKSALKEKIISEASSAEYPVRILDKLLPEEREILLTFAEAIQDHRAGKDRVVCVICQDGFVPSEDAGLECSGSSKHFTCLDCLVSYVMQKSVFDTASSKESLVARSGHLLCPLASDPAFPNTMLTCNSPPFADQDLIKILPSQAFEVFQKGLFKFIDEVSFQELLKKYGGQLRNSNDLLIETIRRKFPGIFLFTHHRRFSYC